MDLNKSRIATIYDTVAAFNVETIFVRKRAPGPRRTIFVNEELPAEYHDNKGRIKHVHRYTTNQVITSKYTVLTFLPRNLLEQFRRIANIFFAAIAILQFFPKFSTISPGLVIFPLLVVLTITALKDAYEDIKRHQSDSRVNHSTVRVLDGGGWSNPNGMHNKSRTFVRGIVPEKLKPRIRKSQSEKSIEDAVPPLEFDNDDGEEQNPKEPHWKKTMWEDVRVGDFVKIMDNESLPADILICATSEEENVAFVETKNLDGETNLKSRNAAIGLTHLRTAQDCAASVFRVDCDRPDNDMFKLNAAVSSGEKKLPVDLNMTLLRGTVLRNTAWVIGVVLFTGEDTKIVLNSGGTPSKRSKVERQMNPQVFINLILLACMAVTCGVVDSVLEHRDYPQGAPWLYADNTSNDNPSFNGLVTWAFALITFQNIVPISLYISIEFVRTCQAAFIHFDWHMWYEKTDQSTLARSWNLSDDLGQIEYIFSDKTGTLTQNSMIFRQCSIGGKVYLEDETDERHNGSASSDTDSTKQPPSDHHFHSSQLTLDLAQSLNVEQNSEFAGQARMLNGFFTVLALCHSVLTAVDPETGNIRYKAQSPDEAALVQAAADCGYVFKGREREILYLQNPGEEESEKYELLNILEFTSARKRMSVVLRKLDSSDGRLFLLTKGADNVIFERLKKGSDESLKEMTEMQLNEFANGGLRTLTLAFKFIQESEYAAWSERYHEASVAMEDRETKLEQVSDELEQDLRLLGATAIEDSLQDGVPETIADLKLAGIKIWVATGDKMETAIAIGHSTNLIANDSNIVVVRGGSDPAKKAVYDQMVHAVEEFFPDSGILEDVKQSDKNHKPGHLRRSSQTGHPSRPSFASHGSSRFSHNDLRRVETRTGVSSIVGPGNGERPGGFVLVIDGTALGYALGDARHKTLLLRLAMLCEAVICCRVSPLQKALVVRLVKDGIGAMTLAIGDGANDVSMIQAADVGVGISGEEGLQAVNSSDYAIAQFRFLKRLLLVHGHWSYARNGNMILNFFYKNIVCIGVLWWFQIYANWSSTYVFDYTFLLFWNSFWTIAPVIAIGIFDRLIDSDVLMALPELYRYGREGRWFGLKWFALFMLDGIYQSAVIFFLVAYTYMSTPTSRTDGYNIPLNEFSTTMVIAAVFAVNFFNGLNTRAWTGWIYFSVLFGIVFIWCFTIVYSLISPGFRSTTGFGIYWFIFRSAYFYFCLPLTVVIALLPRYIAMAWKFCYNPDDIDIMRYIRKYEPERDPAEAHKASALTAMKNHPASASVISRRTSRSSVGSVPHRSRPSMDIRSVSRTDMSTGLRSVHRGFDFATEEGGVAMRRMQSNLSQIRLSSRNLAEQSQAGQTQERHRRRKLSEGVGHVFSKLKKTGEKTS
ncbi:hypothetical protein C8J56DRAFT_1172699 [Mycena floridula]|nr:hypothetical protein C8J56DRAFT_1172699 [Mycena floridula]